MSNRPRSNRERADAALARMDRAIHRPFVLEWVSKIKAGAPAEGAPLILAHKLLPDGALEAAMWAAIAPSGRVKIDDESGQPFWSGNDLRDRWSDAVLHALCAGTLVAAAYDSRKPVDAGAVPIPAERWSALTPNFEANEIACDGFTLTGVRVSRATMEHDPAPKARNRKKPGPKTPYEPELRSTLTFLSRNRSDLFSLTDNAIEREVRRAWSQSPRKFPLPERRALSSAIKRIRQELGI